MVMVMAMAQEGLIGKSLESSLHWVPLDKTQVPHPRDPVLRLGRHRVGARARPLSLGQLLAGPPAQLQTTAAIVVNSEQEQASLLGWC